MQQNKAQALLLVKCRPLIKEINVYSSLRGEDAVESQPGRDTSATNDIGIAARLYSWRFRARSNTIQNIIAKRSKSQSGAGISEDCLPNMAKDS